MLPQMYHFVSFQCENFFNYKGVDRLVKNTPVSKKVKAW